MSWYDKQCEMEIEESMNHSYSNGYEAGYNNALDDFVNACKEDIMCHTFGLRECDIVKIAEHLKADGKINE